MHPPPLSSDIHKASLTPSRWDTSCGSAPGSVTDTLGRLGALKARSAQVTSSAAVRPSRPAPGVT